MKKFSVLLVSTLAVALLVMPAAAQQPDPYSGVLPGGAERPDDVTAPPDGGAVLGGGAERSDDGTVRQGAEPSAPSAVEAPSRGDVGAAGRPATPVPTPRLPVTGGESTVILLALGAALLAAGTSAMLVARRRGHLES